MTRLALPADWFQYQAWRMEIAAEAIDIARAALAGDPFREVPDLEVRREELFKRFDLGEPLSEEIEADIRAHPAQAYKVALTALHLAHSAGGAMRL
ncbi:MAG TPA: hypothetical protein VES65_11320 [Solirubrobacteraceae bacterium]|nr:hypothetical protein [Solirubrobacteraceae bacterium]